MRTLRTAAVRVALVWAAACSLTVPAWGQGALRQPAGLAAPGALPMPAAGPNPWAVGPGEWMDAHGQPVVVPASYGAPMGGGYPGGPQGGCYGGPGGGGYAGADPYGGQATTTEQCGPHYFDFSAEYVYLKRDGDVFGDGAVISTEGFAQNPTQVANQAALVGSDVDGGEFNGYRLTGRIDVGALSVFEIAYTGLYDTDNGNAVALRGPGANQTLFTVFSNFGTATNPGTVPNQPGEPLSDLFEETDGAEEHRLRFESEMHTAEATLRRYWVGYSPRVSGTLLAGFRYTSLEEALGFFSQSDNGTIDIDLGAENRLAGFQVGGDAWVTLIQGLRIGAEGKVGIYNNDFEFAASSVASDGSPNGVTAVSDNQVAFLTEFKAMAVADLTPSWSVKGGYELLYISELALAGDRFGDLNPYDATPVALGDADGEVLYHGFHIGAEYVW